MRTRILVYCILPILSLPSFAADQTKILYETFFDSDSGRWQYTYDVCNVSLSDTIEEFTVWFGIGSYDNLTITTLDPPSGDWDEIVWDPEPFLGDDGGYDALATGLNIAIGEHVYGFADQLDTDFNGFVFEQGVEVAGQNAIRQPDRAR